MKVLATLEVVQKVLKVINLHLNLVTGWLMYLTVFVSLLRASQIELKVCKPESMTIFEACLLLLIHLRRSPVKRVLDFLGCRNSHITAKVHLTSPSFDVHIFKPIFY
jgi:hypothetical protein